MPTVRYRYSGDVSAVDDRLVRRDWTAIGRVEAHVVNREGVALVERVSLVDAQLAIGLRLRPLDPAVSAHESSAEPRRQRAREAIGRGGRGVRDEQRMHGQSVGVDP